MNDLPPYFLEVQRTLLLYLPAGVRNLTHYFDFDREVIIEEAKNEGCHIIYGRTREVDSKIDSICQVLEDKILFLRRQYFKGKPGKDFKLERDNKPAYYSPTEIGYYKSGELHREGDLPAYLSLWELTWNINGKWHRDGDNPSIINIHRGPSYHKNHELYKRKDVNGVRVFIGFENGIGQWKKEGE